MTSLPELRPFRPQPRDKRPLQIYTHPIAWTTPRRWGTGEDWYGGDSPKACTRDDLSDVALMGRACDIWYEAWHKGICLTPPYISMKNWYARMQIDSGDHPVIQDVDDDAEFDVAVEATTEFMSDEGE